MMSLFEHTYLSEASKASFLSKNNSTSAEAMRLQFQHFHDVLQGHQAPRAMELAMELWTRDPSATLSFLIVYSMRFSVPIPRFWAPVVWLWGVLSKPISHGIKALPLTTSSYILSFVMVWVEHIALMKAVESIEKAYIQASIDEQKKTMYPVLFSNQPLDLSILPISKKDVWASFPPEQKNANGFNMMDLPNQSFRSSSSSTPTIDMATQFNSSSSSLPYTSTFNYPCPDHINVYAAESGFCLTFYFLEHLWGAAFKIPIWKQTTVKDVLTGASKQQHDQSTKSRMSPIEAIHGRASNDKGVDDTGDRNTSIRSRKRRFDLDSSGSEGVNTPPRSRSSSSYIRHNDGEEDEEEGSGEEDGDNTGDDIQVTLAPHISSDNEDEDEDDDNEPYGGMSKSPIQPATKGSIVSSSSLSPSSQKHDMTSKSPSAFTQHLLCARAKNAHLLRFLAAREDVCGLGWTSSHVALMILIFQRASVCYYTRFVSQRDIIDESSSSISGLEKWQNSQLVTQPRFFNPQGLCALQQIGYLNWLFQIVEKRAERTMSGAVSVFESVYATDQSSVSALGTVEAVPSNNWLSRVLCSRACLQPLWAAFVFGTESTYGKGLKISISHKGLSPHRISAP
ncbi:unnamed protein product [Sphagnum jensenii]|uniref:Uncharacterized protein n=1 Tax=Sphagnum jensenii TaxID=128206 RepID=A0ABP0VCD6_9BRYO